MRLIAVAASHIKNIFAAIFSQWLKVLGRILEIIFFGRLELTQTFADCEEIFFCLKGLNGNDVNN